MRNQAQAFQLLLDLTRELTENELHLDDALTSVTEAALNLFDGQHASLRVLDESGVELLSGARAGVGESEEALRFQRGQGVAGWVVENREVARIDDAAADPRFVHFASQSYTIRSLLAIPLWSAGEVIGCLTITSGEVSHFDDDDELIGRLLANCAVPPLERARLQRLAMMDAQTNAFAHSALLPRMEREITAAQEKGHPLSALLMDLDHFKQVNDRYGHAAGDEVLAAFGRMVLDLVRRDDVFFRRGGEEFLLLMPRCPLQVALRAAERIRAHLASAPIRISSPPSQDGIAPVELHIEQRVSIGVAEWLPPEDARSLEARADAAMYAAKAKGRNRVESARPERPTLDIRRPVDADDV